MAARGRLLPALLDDLLADPYFRRPPPKTAGREQYGERLSAQVTRLGPPPSRAARGLGAHRNHLHRALDRRRPSPLGAAARARRAAHRRRRRRAQSAASCAQIAAALPDIEIIPSDALGVPGDAKEAFAFALLAYETIHRRPANLPSATGAARPAILGKICYPPPR